MLYRSFAVVASLAALAAGLAAAQAPAASEAPAAAGAGPPVVVFLGDSLTAGFGLAADEAFPALVAASLAARGTPIRAINAGVSGDTTAGGLRRLDWALRSRPQLVVVALGANDGLRGQPLEAIEANLRAIVERCRAAGAKVLLAGMLMPPNYGGAYASGFAAIYPRLAKELGLPLVPFLLEGVAGRPELNQADGIHPTAEGQKILARQVEPYLAELLGASAGRGGAAKTGR
ncbi:MAG: arylesterase [Acidobacteria bacterium]|jgi:acyl-CoA thioesterase-1|nr:arylesterase [Acidobacteriota bacterium]